MVSLSGRVRITNSKATTMRYVWEVGLDRTPDDSIRGNNDVAWHESATMRKRSATPPTFNLRQTRGTTSPVRSGTPPPCPATQISARSRAARDSAESILLAAHPSIALPPTPDTNPHRRHKSCRPRWGDRCARGGYGSDACAPCEGEGGAE